MNGIIRILDLRVDCIVGVYPHERDRAQPLFIDAELICEVRESARSDNLADTVDYDVLSQQIQATVKASECLLLERVAAMVLGLCVETPGVQAATVRVRKPEALRDARTVEIELSSA
jgi:dihydroneopterin aldolase